MARHKNIKRRLLHAAVQDNLGIYPAALLPHPVVRRVRTGVRKMLLVAVVIVLLPVNDPSTVISTVIQQPGEIPVATMLEAPSEVPISTLAAPPTEALPQAAESAPESRVAALEPQHVEAPPVTLEAPCFASEDVGSAEPTFLAPVPIDLAVLPLGVRKIVIDPGHGGKDAGTSTPGGLAEKEVTLDIGMRLRHLLEQAAFEAVMTRDKDEVVPLRQRTALANAQGADLFVRSISTGLTEARYVVWRRLTWAQPKIPCCSNLPRRKIAIRRAIRWRIFTSSSTISISQCGVMSRVGSRRACNGRSSPLYAGNVLPSSTGA